MNVSSVLLKDIEAKDRARADFGERAQESLKKDIEINGLINPLTVMETAEGYKLLAGGRRLKAVEDLGWKEVSCIIMPKEIDGDMLELRENIHRKAFHWAEEIVLMNRIKEKNPDMPQGELANKLGVSRQKVNQALVLYNAVIANPVEYLGFSNFSAAFRHMSDIKMFQAEKEQAIRNEARLREKRALAEKTITEKIEPTKLALVNKKTKKLEDFAQEFLEQEEPQQPEKIETLLEEPQESSEEETKKPEFPLASIAGGGERCHWVSLTKQRDAYPLVEMSDSYYVGSFLESSDRDKLRFSPYDTIEIDPPYGIDYKEGDIVYEDISQTEYPSFLKDMLETATSLAKETARMIVWHGHMWEPLIQTILKDLGWNTDELPIIWSKETGNTPSPRLLMPRTYEQFIMAYRGNARLRFPLNNVIRFGPLYGGERIHPAHRPPSMIAQLLSITTPAYGTVLSPFLGSGATIIAGYTCGFKTEGFDIKEEYRNKFINYLDEVPSLGFTDHWVMEKYYDNYYVG